MIPRVGLGFDVHAFATDDRPLVLGGVTIAGHAGLDGHSDADAVAHAVADALLSAAGLPDLGTRFPATDDTLRGVASMTLLDIVAAEVASHGFRVGNVSVVVIAEEPKLAPHLEAITEGVRHALAAYVAPNRRGAPLVSVTAKRGEGLDAVGEGRGIAVHTVVLLTT